MPITQFLDSPKFDPETKRVVGVAFEMARAALQLDDQGNLINERIAKRIIELAKAGELDPNLLCECVLREFRHSTCRRRSPQGEGGLTVHVCQPFATFAERRTEGLLVAGLNFLGATSRSADRIASKFLKLREQSASPSFDCLSRLVQGRVSACWHRGYLGLRYPCFVDDSFCQRADALKNLLRIESAFEGK